MSKNDLEKIIKKLEALETRISQLEQGRENNTLDNQSNPQKKLSLREFLLSKNQAAMSKKL